MTDDPRHPHLASGYFAQEGAADMAARPVAIDAPTMTMTGSGRSVDDLVASRGVVEPQGEAPDHTMASGRALEEMPMGELRKRAAARGISSRGLRKPALIAKLRA